MTHELREVELKDSVAISDMANIDSRVITNVYKIGHKRNLDVLYTTDGRRIYISPYWVESIRPIGGSYE